MTPQALTLDLNRHSPISYFYPLPTLSHVVDRVFLLLKALYQRTLAWCHTIQKNPTVPILLGITLIGLALLRLFSRSSPPALPIDPDYCPTFGQAVNTQPLSLFDTQIVGGRQLSLCHTHNKEAPRTEGWCCQETSQGTLYTICTDGKYTTVTSTNPQNWAQFNTYLKTQLDQLANGDPAAMIKTVFSHLNKEFKNAALTLACITNDKHLLVRVQGQGRVFLVRTSPAGPSIQTLISLPLYSDGVMDMPLANTGFEGYLVVTSPGSHEYGSQRQIHDYIRAHSSEDITTLTSNLNETLYRAGATQDVTTILVQLQPT
jgi:hypothetical protein